MKVLINGEVYDSTIVPVLLVFDDNEQEMFGGMKRFVSAPEESTKEERESLIMREVL
jgi:hypothetical protein